jgi:hypothetical protein
MDRAGCGVVDRGGGEARFARAAAAAIVMTTNNRFARASLPRSFDSFRQPNFVLVADILFFLVQRYDPSLRLSQDIETEQERVTFLKSIAEVMATKMRIKLNTK